MSELIDNRSRRIQTLKSVVRGLHEGEPLERVKGRLIALVRQCDASEVAAMEQQLMADGMPMSEVMRMCDLHAQAVSDVLGDACQLQVPPGHPVDTFRRENAALREQVGRLRQLFAGSNREDGDGSLDPAVIEGTRAQYGLLMDIDKHYERKEQLLFPCLERHGIIGPSTVMWGKDDEIRGLLDELGTMLTAADGVTREEWSLVGSTAAERAFAAVEAMIFKEEQILFPMALQHLTEAEWGEIESQAPEIGYCLVDSVTRWERRSPTAAPDEGASSDSTTMPEPDRGRGGGARSVVFPSGSL
jgi:DUF438 domain-containing protein